MVNYQQYKNDVIIPSLSLQGLHHCVDYSAATPIQSHQLNGNAKKTPETKEVDSS